MSPTRSVIIGIGGAGLATITCLHELGCQSAETIAVDTDPEALYHARAARKILLNKYWVNTTFTSIAPEAKRSVIERDLARIRDATNRDLVILVGGLGGTTGTRLTPLFARDAKDQGALVIALPIMPFHSEKEMSLLRARRGLATLAASSDTVVSFSNQTLLSLREGKSLAARFKILDSLIIQILQGLVRLVNNWGRINLDLADVRTVLGKRPEHAGFIGVCEVHDITTFSQKVLQMFLNPLQPVNPKFVGSAVISIVGSKNLSLRQVDTIVNVITGEIAEHATIKFGVMIEPNLESSIRVTVLGACHVQKGEDRVSLSEDQIPLINP